MCCVTVPLSLLRISLLFSTVRPGDGGSALGAEIDHLGTERRPSSKGIVTWTCCSADGYTGICWSPLLESHRHDKIANTPQQRR